MGNQIAKMKLQKMINNLIKKEKYTNDTNCFSPIHESHFSYNNMDEYLRALSKAKSEEKKDPNHQNNLVVQHIDYLINPSIKVKN